MTANDDVTRLGHMRDAAQEILEFMEGETLDSFENNRLLQLAVVRLLEVIGEAANYVSVDCQRRHPELPWRGMIGMRNRLIHAYFGVDLNVIWKTVTEDLEDLLALIEVGLGQERGDSS